MLGGTFNPPHVGHLICAQEAHAQLGLDRVLLVPVARAAAQGGRADPGAEHRVALCEAAVGGRRAPRRLAAGADAGPVVHGRYAREAA